MTAGNIENRHPGLAGLFQRGQLLIDRIASTTLDTGKHFHAICTTAHSRTPRLTPSLWLCSHVRSKRGLLHRCSTRRYAFYAIDVALRNNLVVVPLSHKVVHSA